MSKRQLRCLLGPMNGQRVWLDSREHYWEFAVFPEMTYYELMSKPTTPIADVAKREIYVVKTLRWIDEEIPVLVPAHYSEDALNAALIESLFR